jgi:predicted PurR-regulated permease PerM
MDNSSLPASDKVFLSRAMEATIRIGLVILLAIWCLEIVSPFIVPVCWGVIIAVALHPLHRRLTKALGEHRVLAATLVTLALLLLLITPTVMLTGSTIDTAEALADGLLEGAIKVPPPPASVATWPFIGESLNSIWSLASTNLEAALGELAPQLKAVGKWLLAAAAGTGFGILTFTFSIIIAGVFLANAAGGQKTARAIASRIAGERGPELADLAGATVRSVAQGVVGVAIIQALLAGIGLLVVGVPGAGLWTLLVLILAVVQLPLLLILGPMIIYVFSTAGTITAVLFMIWGLLVSASDGFLKPLLLGRGVQIPMLVILIGAIGGMISAGIIGLFVGSVILALGYKLFLAWLHEATPASPHGGD